MKNTFHFLMKPFEIFAQNQIHFPLLSVLYCRMKSSTQWVFTFLYLPFFSCTEYNVYNDGNPFHEKRTEKILENKRRKEYSFNFWHVSARHIFFNTLSNIDVISITPIWLLSSSLFFFLSNNAVLSQSV